jgi:hypothetical protein
MRLLVVFFIVLLVFVQIVSAQQQKGDQIDDAIHIVSTSEIAAELAVNKTKERITGRTSFHLVVHAQDGRVAVRGFNIAFFGVQQKLLGGESASEPLGLLAFGVVRDKAQTLRYDRKTGQLSGELHMFADASYLNAFAEPVGDGKGDVYESPVVPAIASIQINLAKPLSDEIDTLHRVTGKLELKLHCKGFKHEKFFFPELEIQLLEPFPLVLNLSWSQLIEIAQKLCIQPVRIRRITWWDFGGFPIFQESGAGLAFGEQGARWEWAKADVIFEIREWKTIWEFWWEFWWGGTTYWVLEEPEENDLLPLIDDDDCIELFFVYDFDPQDRWGGGATWGSGTASAKIISSDGNARGGVDLTHLAHELGHVLGLLHPGSPARPSAQPASSGTLMCPSGYLNDNPQINSQENKDLLSNPLLTFYLKPRTPGPDCLNSADCGNCP